MAPGSVAGAVAPCTQAGLLVGCYGPFKAGKRAGTTTYRKLAKPKLLPGEMVEVGRGYIGEETYRLPQDFLSRSEKVAKGAAAGLVAAAHQVWQPWQAITWPEISQACCQFW